VTEKPLFYEGLWIPASYVSNSRKTISVSAPAAMTLELLIAKDPTLFSTIIEGSTSADGLRKTTQKLNRIQAGLYSELRTVPYEYNDFATTTKSIIDKLFNGDARAPLRAHEYVRDLMRDMITMQKSN
jgi:hypothetical protein